MKQVLTIIVLTAAVAACGESEVGGKANQVEPQQPHISDAEKRALEGETKTSSGKGF